MRRVTKDEVKILREKFPYVHIRRTVNTYYAEENRRAMKYLNAANQGFDKAVNTHAKT